MPFAGKIRWRKLAGPAVILLAALVAAGPLLVRGTSCGHDFDFHLASWFDVLNSWRHGIFYPHWSPGANFGAGEPRFVFYPPLTWMLGAALGWILPWARVEFALVYLLLAGAGLATRALARQALPDGPATLAGCTSLFSGYALFTTFERSAFGELSGGIWIPLLLLLILRNRNASASTFRRAFDGSAVPLALVLAAAWLSNAPVGVMACYLLAAVTLVVAVLSRSWAPVLRGLAAGALGLGLAAVYVIPAAVEQHWVEIRQATDDPGLLIENSWLFGHHTDPALDLHDVELTRVSAIVVTMVAVALACILMGWLRGSLPRKRAWWIPLALVPAVVLLLQFPVSEPIWNALPKLRFLQFPWRWLVVLEAPMGIFFAAAVWTYRRRLRVVVLSICALFFIGASGASGVVFFQKCDAGDSVQGMLDAYRHGAGYAGTDEYAPPGADDSLVVPGLPDACLTVNPTAALAGEPDGASPGGNAGNGKCDAVYSAKEFPGKTGGERVHIAATTSHAGYLVLRLRTYPAWRVGVNGRAIAIAVRREDGMMVVPVPQGPVDLTVDWTTTGDAVAGRWLSLLALALLAGLCLLERKLSLQASEAALPRLS